MESSKYIEDLASIKTMMSKSSRFMSISGLSGILAGVYALIAFFVTYRILSTVVLPGISVDDIENARENQTGTLSSLFSAYTGGYDILAIIGLTTLLAAVLTGIFLTVRKARKHNEKIWDSASKRLIVNFSVPLATGGAFCLVLFQYGIIGLVAPCTLIFYGLALINASKFTLGDIKYLGIANVIIGLISTQFIGYGIFFWALGFGVFHIFYGTLMYLKYDRNVA